MDARVRVTYYVLANKKYFTQCLTTTTRPYEICNYTFLVDEEDFKKLRQRRPRRRHRQEIQNNKTQKNKNNP